MPDATPRLVDLAAPRDPTLFYGASCIPNLKGVMWECKDRAEYLAFREAFEASEGNCNTCVHLVRLPAPKDPLGFLIGRCARCQCPGTTVTFHPEDPLQLACHEQRTKTKKG